MFADRIREYFGDEDKAFLSTTEVAQFYGTSRQAVGRMIEHGDVPAIRLGAHWRIPVEELGERMDREIRVTADNIMAGKEEGQESLLAS